MASVSDAEMRKQIKTAYPSDSWSDKVDKMPDRQVYSIYQNLLKQHKIKGI